jgi:CubicO group peptidase (beta-lactamase class C family)
MKSISVVSFAIKLLFGVSIASHGLMAETKKEINLTFLDEMVSQGHLPSYQVAVISADGTLSHKAGYYKDGIVGVSPVNKESIISLLSLSKPFTNLLALKLIDIGALKLDDPISNYLPEFQAVTVQNKVGGSDGAVRKILVSDLLLHTAGFSQNADLQGWGEIANYYRDQRIFGASCFAGAKQESLESSIQRLAEIPLSNQPGERYSYSVATDVLGRVLEVASGKSFQSLLNKYIAKPLALDSLDTKVEVPNLEKVAQLYEPQFKSYPVPGAYQRYRPFSNFEVTVTNVGVKPGCISPGSGLTATMRDMSKFAQFLLSGMSLENGKTFLSQELTQLAYENKLGPEFGKYPLRRSLAYAKRDGLSLASLAIRPTENGNINEWEDHDYYYWAGFSGSGFWIDKKTNTAGVLITQLYPSDSFLIPKLVAQVRDSLAL